MQLGDQFDSMDSARNAIQTWVLNQGESYQTVKSKKTRFVIKCKDSDCNFHIQATKSKKAKSPNEMVSITIFKPHNCAPTIHYKNRQSQSVKYLVEHHRDAIINN